MARKPRPRLLIYGDSISLGAAEVRNGIVERVLPRCYVDTLRSRLPEVDIVVDAKAHRNTRQAVAELPEVMQQMSADLILCMLGGNDLDLNWRRFLVTNGATVQSNLSPYEYGANLRRLATMICGYDALPLLGDVTDHELTIRGPYMSALAGRDVSSLLAAQDIRGITDRTLAAFRGERQRVVDEMNLLDVPFAADFAVYARPLLVGPDGVHPSLLAHDIIGTRVCMTILQALMRLEAAGSMALGIAT